MFITINHVKFTKILEIINLSTDTGVVKVKYPSFEKNFLLIELIIKIIQSIQIAVKSIE